MNFVVNKNRSYSLVLSILISTFIYFTLSLCSNVTFNWIFGYLCNYESLYDFIKRPGFWAAYATLVGGIWPNLPFLILEKYFGEKGYKEKTQFFVRIFIGFPGLVLWLILPSPSLIKCGTF